jgi:uncharacterized membrane protein YkoI
MRAAAPALIVVSHALRTVRPQATKGRTMRKRILALAAVALVALGAATFAIGGPRGLIFDDGQLVRPGSLDDGKELLAQTKISLATAVATAQRETTGQLGQVDLERVDGRVVYKVDVGDKEVRIDAADGSVATIGPQS